MSKNNIIRVQKNKENPYLILNKECINDDRLTWAAKGLHTYLLSLPDNWTIYVNELINHTSAGRDHTYSVIRELISFGYMQRFEYRYKGKVVDSYYVVYESAIEIGALTKTMATIVKVTIDENGNYVPIDENIENTTFNPNPENTDSVKSDSANTKLLNNNNNKVIKELNNNSVVVVSEKETKLLEMYKFYKIEKRVMPQTKTLLKQYIDKFDLDVFEQIFISASEGSVKKKYAYMKKVFEELDKKNIKTLDEFEEDNKKYKETKYSTKGSTSDKTKKSEDKPLTRFHNINDRTKNYTSEELEALLLENQIAKEAKRLKDESDTNNQIKDEVLEITRELVHDCIIDDAYFNSLNIKTKVAVKEYMINKGGFIPLHIKNI